MIQQAFNQALTGAAFLVRTGRGAIKGAQEQWKKAQMERKAEEKVREMMEKYTVQKEHIRAFREALKGQAGKDIENLVERGINRSVAEKAIISDIEKGVYKNV